MGAGASSEESGTQLIAEYDAMVKNYERVLKRERKRGCSYESETKRVKRENLSLKEQVRAGSHPTFVAANAVPAAPGVGPTLPPGEYPLIKEMNGKNKDMNVLLLGIDGCRADVLLMNAPRIKKLMLQGASAMNVTCPYPALSGPGWATILTGKVPTHHGILDNEFNSLLDDNEKVDCFFDDGRTNTGIFTAWEGLGVFAQGSTSRIPFKCSHEHHKTGKLKCNCDVEYKYCYNGFEDKRMGVSNDEVIKDALKFLKDGVQAEKRNMCFVHLDDLDHVGHFSGYGPYIKPYMDAMLETDEQVSALFDEIDERVKDKGEHWRIVVLTDHGGSAQRFMSPMQKQAFRIKNRNCVAPSYGTNWTAEKEDDEIDSHMVQACLTESTFGVHGLPIKQDKTTFIIVHDSDPTLVQPGELYPEPQFFDVPYFCGYDAHLMEMLDSDRDGQLAPAEIQRGVKMLYEVGEYFS